LIELNAIKEQEVMALTELKWKNDQLAEEVQSLSKEIDVVHAKVSKIDGLKDLRDPKLEKQAHWYIKAKRLLESATGIAVHRPLEGVFEIEYRDTLRNESMGHLSLCVLPTSHRLTDAKAYYSNGTLTPIEDLLQYTLKHEDLRFLIMGTMLRMRHHHLLQKEFDEITRCGYDLQSKSFIHGTEVTVTHPKNYDRFDFLIDYTYPNEPNSLQLKHVYSDHSLKDLQTCQVRHLDLL
jgi:hypothetical protein